MGSFILFFSAEIWLLLSLGLHMKDNAFVLKCFASRLCLEQQGREWNGKPAVMILINVGMAWPAENRLYRRVFLG